MKKPYYVLESRADEVFVKLQIENTTEQFYALAASGTMRGSFSFIAKNCDTAVWCESRLRTEVSHQEEQGKMSPTVVMQAQAQKTPLISGEQATFVWTGERAPVLVGDMTGWRPWEAVSGGQKMEEVGPGVWSCTLTLPPDAYVEYVHLVDGQRRYDPFNPRRVPNGFGELNNCFWMPQAPRSPLFRRRHMVPAGTV